MSIRQFWFSQALEDAEGHVWPLGCDDLCDKFEHMHFHSDGGLIEEVGDAYYAEGYLRPAHELANLPADAVRLQPSPPYELPFPRRERNREETA